MGITGEENVGQEKSLYHWETKQHQLEAKSKDSR